MYLEFIPDVSVYSPLLILSPSIPEEAEKLYQALTNLVTDNNAVVDVHAFAFYFCLLSLQLMGADYRHKFRHKILMKILVQF
jgi:hypothetical protein